MDLAGILKEKQSTVNRDLIVNYVGSSPARMDELMKLFFSKDLRVCQNASWPMTHIGDKYPKLILPYFEEMLHKLKTPQHDAVLRNTLRIWQQMDIPEKYEGTVYELCFKFLANYDRPPAVRAFSIGILSNLADKFPDLKSELIDLLEEVYPHGTPGLKNKAKKTILHLRKNTK